MTDDPHQLEWSHFARDQTLLLLVDHVVITLLGSGCLVLFRTTRNPLNRHHGAQPERSLWEPSSRRSHILSGRWAH